MFICNGYKKKFQKYFCKKNSNFVTEITENSIFMKNFLVNFLKTRPSIVPAAADDSVT